MHKCIYLIIFACCQRGGDFICINIFYILLFILLSVQRIYTDSETKGKE